MLTFAIIGMILTSTVVLGASTSATLLQNGKTAQMLNLAFQTMNRTDTCTNGDKACFSGGIASCENSTWIVGQGTCSHSQSCFAVPTTEESGILVTCTTKTKAALAISASGATGGIFGNSTTMNSDTFYTGTSNGTCSDKDYHRANRDEECDGLDAGDNSSSPYTPASQKHTTHSRAPVDAPGPSVTSPATVTVTFTIGNEPTSLAPVTRTISPQKASIFLSLLMANGATVISSPTVTVAMS
ncbi:hypothetical protein H0H92_003628 [Tricholoma furcatifolium]|nr:hypothetical protein H0H92_003628 [Tricholoma furcatifolium]